MQTMNPHLIAYRVELKMFDNWKPHGPFMFKYLVVYIYVRLRPGNHLVFVLGPDQILDQVPLSPYLVCAVNLHASCYTLPAWLHTFLSSVHDICISIGTRKISSLHSIDDDRL